MERFCEVAALTQNLGTPIPPPASLPPSLIIFPFCVSSSFLVSSGYVFIIFTIIFHTCLGARRTLRTILHTSREAASSAYHTTSGHARFDSDIRPGSSAGTTTALAEPPGTWKELQGNEWDVIRTGGTLTCSARSWVEWESGLEVHDEGEKERLEEAVERVLEEVAGILNELLRGGDDNPLWVAGYASGNGVERKFIEEDESAAIGETLFELAG